MEPVLNLGPHSSGLAQGRLQAKTSPWPSLLGPKTCISIYHKTNSESHMCDIQRYFLNNTHIKHERHAYCFLALSTTFNLIFKTTALVIFPNFNNAFILHKIQESPNLRMSTSYLPYAPIQGSQSAVN